MRKTLFIAALLCLTSFFAKAQYNILTITNGSNCEVYVMVYGAQSSSGCATDYHSSIIMLTPGSTTSWANPTDVPGGLNKPGGSPASLGTTDKFTMVRVYESNPIPVPCTGAKFYDISDCAGASSATASFYDMSCGTCSTTSNITLTTAAPTDMHILIN